MLLELPLRASDPEPILNRLACLKLSVVFIVLFEGGETEPFALVPGLCLVEKVCGDSLFETEPNAHSPGLCLAEKAGGNVTFKVEPIALKPGL